MRISIAVGVLVGVLGTLGVLAAHSAVHPAANRAMDTGSLVTLDENHVAEEASLLNETALLQHLRGLNDCLAKQSKEWHVDKRVSFVSGRFGKPSFAIDLFDMYLEPAMKGVDAWSKNRTLVTTGDRSAVEFDKPSVAKMFLESAWRSLQQMSSETGLKPLACLNNHSLQQAHENMAVMFAKALKGIVEQVEDQWHNLLYAPGGVISQAEKPMQDAFSEFLSGADLLAQAGNFAHEQCAKDVLRSKEQMKSVAKASRKKRAAEIEKLEDMLQDMSEDRVANVSASAVGYQILKLFTQFRTSIIGPRLIQAGVFLQTTRATGLHAVDGLAGLLPDLGAAISATLASAIEAALGNLQAMLIRDAEEMIAGGLEDIEHQIEHWAKDSVKGVIMVGAKAAKGMLKGTAAHFRFLIGHVLKLIKLVLPEVSKQVASCNDLKKNLKEMLESF